MTTVNLMRELVRDYDPDDADYGKKAIARTMKHFDDLPPSKSTKDPTRLGPRSTFISRLKMALLNEAGSLELGTPESKEFDKMTAHEQLNFQKAARIKGSPKWVLPLEIVPQNLLAVRMPEASSTALKNHRLEVDTEKLREEMPEIDGDKLIQRLISLLEKPNATWQELSVGLLLATGRRTIELLQTGDFYLDEHMTSDMAAAVFSGQAKRGDDQPYVIPLLAPFSLVKTAFDKLRSIVSTDGMPTLDVNQTYQRRIATALRKHSHIKELTPHDLRGIYAIATYELMDGKKMSLIGYISRVLGHTNPANAAYYQRIKIVNLTGVYVPNVNDWHIPEGWVAHTAPEEKRVKIILELMNKRLPVTASRIHTTGGGSMAVSQRVIDLNKVKIDEYNKSLKK